MVDVKQLNQDKWPPVEYYRSYLGEACRKFDIEMNEARNRYGLYTIKEWEELLK
jgi:hypothetical protein